MLKRWQIVMLVAVIFLVVGGLAAIIISVLKKDTSYKSQDFGSGNFITENGLLRIVPRIQWLAQPPTGVINKIEQPVPFVVIAHTAFESCNTQSECVLRTRQVQKFHIESRNWSDIGYNFLVGGDGSAYEGRGWDLVGAHTLNYNAHSIGISFIGNFADVSPPLRQFDACEKLLKLGVQIGKLAKDYKIFAHGHLMATISPGEMVYNVIKDWPHFVKNVSSEVQELS